MAAMPRFTVVAPMLNEADNVAQLAHEIAEACTPIGPFEAIFVNDGSTDETVALVEKARERLPQLKLVKRGEISSRDRVVVISTAHGLKFVDFKLQYHEMRLAGVESKLANPPIELPASYTAVRDEMHREIERRFGS